MKLKIFHHHLPNFIFYSLTSNTQVLWFYAYTYCDCERNFLEGSLPVQQLTVSTIIQALSLGPVARWNVNNDDFSVTTEYYSQYSPHLLLLPGLARTGDTPGGGGWEPASWSRGHEAGVSEVCQVRGGLMLGRWRW